MFNPPKDFVIFIDFNDDHHRGAATFVQLKNQSPLVIQSDRMLADFEAFVSEALPVAKGPSIGSGVDHVERLVPRPDDRARQLRFHCPVAADQCETLIAKLDLHTEPRIGYSVRDVNERLNPMRSVIID
jgi:hypothetical protein